MVIIIIIIVMKRWIIEFIINSAASEFYLER